MGKRAAAGDAKRGGAAATPPSSDASGSGTRKKVRDRRGQSAFPWWVWVVGGIALLACVGQIFTGDGKAKGKGKAATSKGTSKGYLELAMRLADMTQIASTLQTAGQLDSNITQELDVELTSIEKEIEDLDGTIARDLRSMVSVVRGTLMMHTGNLTDEQVEKLNNSYTYANPRYWDEYYKKTGEAELYDWYGSWDQKIVEQAFVPGNSESGTELKATELRDLIRPYISQDSRILMFGCGNSDMSEKMYRDGLEDIMNIDISEQLVENLKARLQASMPRARWQYANASALPFEADSFDVTLDKGTLDAIEQNRPLLEAAVAEAHRTLRPGGLFLSVTFNAPHIRVEGQLRKAAEWGSCHSHPFFKPKGLDGSSITYHLHACTRL